jgi:hypothetical protein
MRKPFFGDARAILLKKATHRAAAIPDTVQTTPDVASQRMIRVASANDRTRAGDHTASGSCTDFCFTPD